MSPLTRLRHEISQIIIELTRVPDGPRIRYSEPAGDPGLFGPDSPVWTVHEDFATMLCGGVSALALQAMHPLALAGVWDHSNFREDMLGRLQRTSRFVGATTYASTADAEYVIERVRQIHRSVTGSAPDGRPYAAGDPELLTWVHTSEVYSFLRSYRRYRNPKFPAADQDRYYHEVSRVAIALGAEQVPCSRAEVEAYFQRMQPELEFGERQREIIRLLMNAPAPRRGLQPVLRLYIRGGIDLLPDWAKEKAGLTRTERLTEPLRRTLLHASGIPLRWGLNATLADVARKRVRSG